MTKSVNHLTMLGQRLGDRGCISPYRYLEIDQDGNITLCCYTWLPEHFGNVLTDSPIEILCNAKRSAFLTNMSAGRFEGCTTACPFISSFLANGMTENLGKRFVGISDIAKRIESRPWKVFLTYDRSCNLQCPSCRNGLIMVDPNGSNPESIKLKTIHGKVKGLIDHLLSLGDDVILEITGSGDAFASPLYWDYIRELSSYMHPNLHLSLATNGVLMDERHWMEIKPIWERITNLSISVDAYSRHTYSAVRKNGNFDRLRSNLDMLDDMCKSGCFPNMEWNTNFVVQYDNFMELPDFIRWQLGYETLHRIWTNSIADWGHMGLDRFKNAAVWMDDHPQHGELIRILSDPIFSDPRVDLGNLSVLRRSNAIQKSG